MLFLCTIVQEFWLPPEVQQIAVSIRLQNIKQSSSKDVLIKNKIDTFSHGDF